MCQEFFFDRERCYMRILQKWKEFHLAKICVELRGKTGVKHAEVLLFDLA
jgi:hypothetical protein